MIRRHPKKGQMAVEYLLLLAVVVAIVLVGFQTYLPRTHNAADLYFNKAATAIMGDPNPCGDGFCDQFERIDGANKCPQDCCPGGSCVGG